MVGRLSFEVVEGETGRVILYRVFLFDILVF